ncbi:hypothetical protein J6590_019596 [Homalodisca vitripennis]|nr:hypothetical protein J6590_019596 [Homalodisca vitripennis]
MRKYRNKKAIDTLLRAPQDLNMKENLRKLSLKACSTQRTGLDQMIPMKCIILSSLFEVWRLSGLLLPSCSHPLRTTTTESPHKHIAAALGATAVLKSISLDIADHDHFQFVEAQKNDIPTRNRNKIKHHGCNAGWTRDSRSYLTLVEEPVNPIRFVWKPWIHIVIVVLVLSSLHSAKAVKYWNNQSLSPALWQAYNVEADNSI